MPSSPTSGALAIDSIGPTEAKVTPIITGRRMPTPGKPTHCTSVASPQANRSALIRKATSSGGSLRARPRISGTATAPAYITKTCWSPSVSSLGIGKNSSTGLTSFAIVSPRKRVSRGHCDTKTMPEGEALFLSSLTISRCRHCEPTCLAMTVFDAQSRSLFFQMLLQERCRALPSEFGGRLVVAAALVAMKTVLRVGIHVDLAIAAALLLDDFDVAHRDRRIFLAEMQLRRHVRLLVGVLGDLAAVIADSGRQPVELSSGKEGDRAAHTEADDGYRTVLLR